MTRRFIRLFFISLVIVSTISFWWISRQSRYEIVSLDLDWTLGPTFPLTIQGKNYPTLLDTGSSTGLAISTDIINQIEKKPLDNFNCYDVFGNEYKVPTFSIPNIKIGRFQYSPKRCEGEYEIFQANTTKTPNDQTQKRHIAIANTGLDLLRQTNILLDFFKKKMILCNNTHRLKSLGYDLSKFTPLPFTLTQDGMILEVSLDDLTAKMLIDTGSKRNVINAHLFPQEEPNSHIQRRFKIHNLDFKKNYIHLLKLSIPDNGFDGILGMNFLIYYHVYIDYQNHILYLLERTDPHYE